MTSLTSIFANSPWPGLVAWSALYISDYALTLIGAKLYRAGACDKIAMEGSYEITPLFQADIDALRTISPRFVAALVLFNVLLAVLWNLTRWQPEFYEFALGAMISSQLAVHMRHFRCISLFRIIAGSDAVRGRIEYSRPALLKMSCLELLTVCGFLLVLFVFTPSWFLLGGAAACGSIAWKHWKLAHAQLVNAAVQAVPK